MIYNSILLIKITLVMAIVRSIHMMIMVHLSKIFLKVKWFWITINDFVKRYKHEKSQSGMRIGIPIFYLKLIKRLILCFKTEIFI